MALNPETAPMQTAMPSQPLDELPIHVHDSAELLGQTVPRRRFASRSRGGAPSVGDLGSERVAPITDAPARASVVQRERLVRRSLLGADSLAAGIAFILVGNVLGDDQFRLSLVLAFPLIVLIHKIAGLYDRDDLVLRRSTLDEAPALFQLSGLYALVTWLLQGFLLDGQLGPAQVLGLWAVTFAFIMVGRQISRSVSRRRADTERCLVIGRAATAERVMAKLAESHVNAEVVATMPVSDGHRVALRNGTEEVRRIVVELDIDRVIIAPVSTDSSDMLELIRIAKAIGVRVSVLPRVLEVVGTSTEYDDLDGLTLLGVRRFGLTRSSRVVKRTFDLIGAGVGILAISPILAMLALAVRLDSKGPIFFRQTRIGRDGKPFQMIKFRSMVPDAEQQKDALRGMNETDGLFKIADDPRITRIGRVLRSTSLDELPQLLNVLRGEMSLVGPRPLVADEDAQVEGMFRQRLHLTPGMTGPWQVMGSAKIPMNEMVKIDYLYVAGWTLWADVKLLLRTVTHMASRGGM